ncbi:hypothetical protein ACWEU6_20940 [Streptosporangium sandarakinum]|uniref:hypothetical protein n=1 Tax=Streptosporangium sandarakinum TaxID=1260955 RepID=UPI003692C694
MRLQPEHGVGEPGLDVATELCPHLAAGMALNAFHTVLQWWSDSDGTEDPAALTDRSFAVIAPALDAVCVPGREARACRLPGEAPGRTRP